MSNYTVNDKILILIALVVGIFLLISVVGAFILALSGYDPGGVWDEVFNLVNVLAGALVGYVTGSYLVRREDNRDEFIEITPPEEEGHQ